MRTPSLLFVSTTVLTPVSNAWEDGPTTRTVAYQAIPEGELDRIVLVPPG